MAAQQRRLPLVTRSGAQAAGALRTGDSAGAWRAAVEAAVRESSDDRDLVRIGHEVADREAELHTAAAIAAYARSAKSRVSSEAAQAFLDGLLEASAAAPPPPRPRLLADTVSVKEAAELTGKHERTIRYWARDGTIEATRLGPRELRIYRSSLPRPPAAPAPTTVAAHGGVFDPDWAFFTRSRVDAADGTGSSNSKTT